MNLIEVTTPALEKAFFDVARQIYHDDPYWVCPFDAELKTIFDPAENTFFTHGKAIRWILTDGKGPIGRVAAFINDSKAYGFEVPTGGMGFFECINNREAAFRLFDACRDWLSANGMKAMDGPVNFGENDNYWGLLVDGYTHPGFGMPYNKPWYKEMFEAYGFKVFFEQITNHLDLTVPFPERFWKIAEWVMKKNDFTYRHFDIDQAEKFLQDFKTVYDQAWQFHENFTPIELENLRKTFRNAKAILDPELIWFAYHGEEPIGFEVIFPDINQIIKPFKGKLTLLNKLRLLLGVKLHRYNRARMVIMGISPHYQRYGIESAIIYHLNEAVKHKPWLKELELSWVGDFNPKMQALQVATGSKYAKKHVTYRLPFIPGDELNRSGVIH